MSKNTSSKQNTVLLVGFDSAWTPQNSGAVVGVARDNEGNIKELGVPLPQTADFNKATDLISRWQKDICPQSTIVMIDQPTIVKNVKGQRHVENIVSSPVSRRRSGMQPSNTSRSEMFGKAAPIWAFLQQFDSPDSSASEVWETYPVLAMIALDWVMPDAKRVTGQMPKYNPTRRKTFSIGDWQYVCGQLSNTLPSTRFPKLNAWINEQKNNPRPLKEDQDKIDSCICLVVALHFVEQKCLMVGNTDTGYIAVPYDNKLLKEIETRCEKTNRKSEMWIKTIAWSRP